MSRANMNAWPRISANVDTCDLSTALQKCQGALKSLPYDFLFIFADPAVERAQSAKKNIKMNKTIPRQRPLQTDQLARVRGQARQTYIKTYNSHIFILLPIPCICLNTKSIWGKSCVRQQNENNFGYHFLWKNIGWWTTNVLIKNTCSLNKSPAPFPNKNKKDRSLGQAFMNYNKV